MIKKLLITFFILFFHSFSSLAIYSIQNTIEITSEYDSNVSPIDIYNSKDDNLKKDILRRIFYSNNIEWKFDENNMLNIKFLIGGKEYLDIISKDADSEDSFISQLGLRYIFDSYKGFSLQFLEFTKTQYIRNYDQVSVENDGEILLSEGLLKNILTGELGIGYTSFYYNDNVIESFNFFGGKGSLAISADLFNWYSSLKLNYSFQPRIFSFKILNNEETSTEDINFKKRVDYKHEVSAYLEYFKSFLIKLGYIFQYSSSNTNEGEFLNHILQLNFSDQILPKIVFLFIGTLQFKLYPNNYEEGGNLSQDITSSDVYDQFEREYKSCSSIEAKILYELEKDLSLVLSYSSFFDNTFTRHIGGIGLSIDF